MLDNVASINNNHLSLSEKKILLKKNTKKKHRYKF